MTDESTTSFRDALKACKRTFTWFLRQQDQPEFRVFMAGVVARQAMYRKLQCEFMWKEIARSPKMKQTNLARLKFFLDRWDSRDNSESMSALAVQVDASRPDSTRIAVALLLKRANNVNPADEEF